MESAICTGRCRERADKMDNNLGRGDEVERSQLHLGTRYIEALKPLAGREPQTVGKSVPFFFQ